MLPSSRLPAPVNVTSPTGVPLALKVPLASNVPVEIDKVPDEFTYVVPVTSLSKFMSTRAKEN